MGWWRYGVGGDVASMEVWRGWRCGMDGGTLVNPDTCYGILVVKDNNFKRLTYFIEYLQNTSY